MKWNEAQKQGFTFTGATWSNWDTYSEKLCKEEAAKIKRMYKGADYRIVTDNKGSWLGNDSKAIMGNDLFIKLRDYEEEKSKATIERLNAKKEELRQKLAYDLAELDKRIAQEEELISFAQSCLKNN